MQSQFKNIIDMFAESKVFLKFGLDERDRTAVCKMESH